jgi:hypothetical protein
MKNKASISILLAVLISAANADLTLKVNGLDTSMPVEIKPDDDIIIAISGQTEEQKEDFVITCDTGCKLTPLSDTNLSADDSVERGYLFTCEDEAPALPIVNLTVAGMLDYQLAFFIIPDSNTVVFGIESDAIEINVPEPKPDTETEQIDLQLHFDSNSIVPYAQKKEQEKEESLKYCPAGQGLIPVTEELSAKENRGRELPLGGGRGGSTMGILSIIDISSDITSNQIWTADNTYHIIADVNVQALLVIEPGIIVEFAADKAMFVNNGGTLISAGTPNEPVIYTSDSGTPGYADYYCPMYIEETASSSTKIMYSYVEYAYISLMVLNNKLETDIQNNYFYNNV